MPFYFYRNPGYLATSIADGVLPVGSITMSYLNFSDTPPDGYLFCNGALLNIMPDYLDLYGIIGIKFGGNGVTTFQLPDMRGRFVRAVQTGAAIGTVGGVGGSKTHGHSVGTGHTHTLTDHAHTGMTLAHTHTQGHIHSVLANHHHAPKRSGWTIAIPNTSEACTDTGYAGTGVGPPVHGQAVGSASGNGPVTGGHTHQYGGDDGLVGRSAGHSLVNNTDTTLTGGATVVGAVNTSTAPTSSGPTPVIDTSADTNIPPYNTISFLIKA